MEAKKQKTRREFILEAQEKLIVCYGAGNYSKNTLAFLDSEGLDNFIIVDSSEEKWGSSINGVIIQSPKVLDLVDEHKTVIIITSKNFSFEIEKNIRNKYNERFSIYTWPLLFDYEEDNHDKLRYERIVKPCEDLYREIADNRKDKEEYLKTKLDRLSRNDVLILPRIPVILTTRCTLCCKECSNLIPYYNNPRDYAVVDIIKWIENLVNVVDEWIVLELVGGEPFLFIGLETVIENILRHDKIQRIELTTNGSIIPNEKILKLFQNERVFIKISEYPGLVQSDKLVNVLQNMQIKHRLIRDMRWSRTGELVKRNRDKATLKSQYLNCGPAKICRTILNGKLYVCSKAASLAELGFAKDIENVDLMNTNGLKGRVKHFMEIEESKACDYCDMGTKDEIIIEPAMQL